MRTLMHKNRRFTTKTLTSGQGFLVLGKIGNDEKGTFYPKYEHFSIDECSK